MKVNHIVVATDLSDLSFDACEPIREFAKEHSAKLTILHVVHMLSAVPHGAPLAPAVPPPDIDYNVRSARETLEKQRERRDWGDVELAVEIGDDIAETVRDYAKDNDVDLVCVSTHGRTGFRHLVLGSVAEAILRHSKVPVMVFPNPHQ